MGRCCSDCGDWCSCSMFSRNQWLKGDGYSRCKNCVSSGGSYSYQPQYQPTYYQCSQCYREFNSENELNMHMQVHRPRNVACPVCGEQRFRSGANAVQHVESGYCRGCRGKDNARQQIYQFAQSRRGMQPFMTETPLLTNGSSNSGVPDFPYHCPQCAKSFRQLSQLLQHQDQKHGTLRMIGY